MQPKAQFVCGICGAFIWLASGISSLVVSSDISGRAFGLLTAIFALDAVYDAWLGYRRMKPQKASSENQDVGDRMKPRWYRLLTAAVYGPAILAFCWHAFRVNAANWHSYRIGTVDWRIISFLAILAAAFLLPSLFWRDRPTGHSHSN